MKLFYRKIGVGKPLIVLHGLFGQSDNWNYFGKQFSEQGFEVYLVDLRNHGNSPHSNAWNYQLMSDDIFELISDLGLLNKKIILLGHSMGGKVSMNFTIQHPELVNKLIVVDIAPKYHFPDNKIVLNALKSVDLNVLKTRKEVEEILSDFISDNAVKQFLLKNIYWKEADENTRIATLAWRFNQPVILKEIDNVNEAVVSNEPCNVPTLFIRGELSNYILDEDFDLIKKLFSKSEFVTIQGAGHWVHADKPKEFLESVFSFIS